MLAVLKLEMLCYTKKIKFWIQYFGFIHLEYVGIITIYGLYKRYKNNAGKQAFTNTKLSLKLIQGRDVSVGMPVHRFTAVYLSTI